MRGTITENDIDGHKRYGHCEFEMNPFACDLAGYIRASVSEVENPEGPYDAKTIIACDEDWYVKVEWKLGWIIAPLMWLLLHLCLSQSIGPGPEYSLDCNGDGRPCIDRFL
jgi:hypothetical protein